jgi:hypothetical protein
MAFTNKGATLETSIKWAWVIDTAGKLDELDQQREQLREAIGTHTDTRRILQQWAALVQELGVLRSRDTLEIAPTPFMEWRFTPTSSGAYLDGTLHVLAYRDGVSHRATLRMREYVALAGGKVSRYRDENGEDRSAGVYISDTTLPDKARDIVNAAIKQAWEYMAEPLADIFSECVAYEVAKELRDGNTYKARRLVSEYGEVK